MKKVRVPRNVHQAIKFFGHDEDFKPSVVGFEATVAPPGSLEKLEVMRSRVEQGVPIFHQDDGTHEGFVGGRVEYNRQHYAKGVLKWVK